MNGNLTITVVDRDPDYVGINVRAVNERFAASARIYAGIGEMTELADRLAGFPASVKDERTYELGSRQSGVAGGFCGLLFHCYDGSGHPRVELVIEDDAGIHEAASASFGFDVSAAKIDQFEHSLRQIDSQQNDTALLETL